MDAYERLGYETARLLADVGLKRSDLNDPDGSIACALCRAFVQRAQQVRPLKNMWARLAAETPLGAFQLLDYLIVTSNTAGDGLKQLARYSRLVGAPFVLDIREEEDPIRVVYVSNGTVQPSSVEYGVTLSIRHLSAETGQQVKFVYASLTHQPDDVAELEEILGCPVRAGASWAGMALPREAWQIPLRRRDPILRHVLESHAGAVLPRTPAVDGVALDVRRKIESRLGKGEIEIEAIARDLAVSTRTLQRRLAAAGLSFQELVDTVRRKTAEKCVADTSLSIAEVAYLLGYSELAAFHRAFRRWTGSTPQAFRRRNTASTG